MLIQERMRKEKFSEAQKAVIDFLLKDPAAARELTVRQIARACYTSSATLIRVAQKLGYGGWDDFKKDFIREQEYLAFSFSDVNPNIPFSSKDSLRSIAHKIAELKMEAVQDTLHLLDIDELKKAAAILQKAQVVNIIGSNNTRLLGDLFALKLGRIHKLALCHEIRGEILYNGLLMRPDSCTVVISYSGETDAILDTLQQARDAGRPIIALTSVSINSIAKMADVSLRFCTREKMYSKINWYTTEAGIEYLLDLLYSALFWKDYDRNLDLRLSIARQIEHDRKASAEIMNEDPQDEKNAESAQTCV
ncbi:MAG: MurR/RpiR family transcriptional regulator [Erysipelotrichaceae bacterium]|nr:MurR/RpiR family transcriptional regulator [Erysipelotrichaceae bacterium]